MYIPDSLITVYGAQIGSKAVHVYLFLASRADRDGQASPSLGEMATILGLSRQTIRKGLKQLIAHGLIERAQRQSFHGDADSSLYTICLGRSEIDPGSLDFYPGSLDFYPPSPSGNGSEISSLGSPVLDSSPVPDPKILLDPKTQNPKPRARARRTIPTNQPGFDRWWAIYTPSRAMEKQACLSLWIRDDLEECTDDVIAHTLAMQQTRQWQDEEKIPHAKTYLSKQQYTAPPPKPAPHQYAHGMTYTQEETDRFIDEEEKWRTAI